MQRNTALLGWSRGLAFGSLVLVAGLSACSASDSDAGGGAGGSGNSGNVSGNAPTNGGSTGNSGGTGTVGGRTGNNGGSVGNTGGSGTTGGAGGSANVGGTNSGAGMAGSSPTAGAAGTTPTGPCAEAAGMISNFETVALETKAPPISKQEGWTGSWEGFKDAAGTQTVKVEASGGTAECDKQALHATGMGAASYVGIGFNLKGTGAAPTVYDASKWTGIRFKAKKGAGQAASPVRLNIATPFTEGVANGGKCTAAEGCFNHIGRFMTGTYDLTDQWKTYTLCFDRDLYPLYVPSITTPADRRLVSANVLKIQFQFNKGKNLTAAAVSGSQPEYAASLGYDFWVDDVAFTAEACPAGATFASSAGSALPFPQNKPFGTCELPVDAAKMNGAVAAAYANWKTQFLKNDGRITGVDVDNKTPSEAIGYGMLIAAAMGDKPTFDLVWGYGKAQGAGTGLMKWREDGQGSATDGDLDMAYGLLMANAQWGGAYATDASGLIGRIYSGDIIGGHTSPGSNWTTGSMTDAYNPSYFTPAYYQAFDKVAGQSGRWATVRTTDYGILNKCATAFAGGLVPDWCLASSGAPAKPTDFGAAVTSEFCQQYNYCEPMYSYDAARVPWRVGMEACVYGSTEAKTFLSKMIATFASQHGAGATINTMQAGWTKLPGPHAMAKRNQMSFIGPVAIGAMSANRVMFESAYRAMLDIMENAEFNRTYYPTTLGMITLLQMTGNFPVVQ